MLENKEKLLMLIFGTLFGLLVGVGVSWPIMVHWFEIIVQYWS
jgi:sensor histidine kinase regulating citrate/malate metabolism